MSKICNEVLILRRAPKDGLTRELEWCDVSSYYRIRGDGFFLRAARKLSVTRLFNLFLGGWKRNIKKYDIVIMFDNGYNKMIAEYVKRENPDCEIILWFWNKIFAGNKKYLNDGVVDEFWSYNLDDVKKYGLQYNTQFYTNKIKIQDTKIKNDVVFLGRDKGRREDLLALSEELKKQGLKVQFDIIENESDFRDYDDYLSMVASSRAIFDYNFPIISGCTLRVMESIFFEKKLITNNTNIMNYDFYRPENIFIIGKDDMGKIKDFINSPYKKIDKKIVEYYDFENWLKRFKEKK